jgi:hypothetical protein
MSPLALLALAQLLSGEPGSSPQEERARIPLDPPGVNPDVVTSATQRPWVDGNGWRFRRQGQARFVQEPPAGRGPLAVAEAHLHGADVLFEIAPGDRPAVAALRAQLRAVPALPWPDVAQIEVVDDGSELVGEVMNLLSRRNLMWRPRRPGAPASAGAMVVQIGTPAYPVELARSPDELANQVRRRLGDDRRALRVYGSEAVLCRLQIEAGRARLSLLNYARGLEEGVRVRLRGTYPRGVVVTDHVLSRPPLDPRTAGGATELTVPPFRLWAIVDLESR